MATRKKARTAWYRVDLHLHTPASADYAEPAAGYIDILRKAEQRGIDIIAFTDHNTVGGYGALLREIDQLTLLQDLGRAQAEELRLLAEYRRLLDKILVLPGFEFTATFGFHILGIFPAETPLRVLEHLLLSLNIPPAVLDAGNSEVGASSDVLSAYRAIYEAGGICIAAHVNSTHGVAMTGMDFGGQTRIAYTQDKYLHALEVTDLGKRDRGSTQKFFDGTKPEYPRRMRCVQGSDAHALTTIKDKAGRTVTLGIGERMTEVALTERSFEALLEMFQSSDWTRSRVYNPNRQPEDYVQLAREEGETLIQSFHETVDDKTTKFAPVLQDVCAFANTNGGTVYVGISADKKKKLVGLDDAKNTAEALRREISQRITPALYTELDTPETGGKTVLRVQVPFGEDRPYAIDGNQIYVRDENETTLAVRDEIVNLARQGLIFQQSTTPARPTNHSDVQLIAAPAQLVPNLPVMIDTARPVAPVPLPQAPLAPASGMLPPRAGVEIVDTEQRDGKTYYTMHDLRNGNIVRNVTLSSARRLWHYAVKQRESNPIKPEEILWVGEIGLGRKYKKGGDVRYDLVQQDGGRVRIYYGVTDNGMHGEWAQFLEAEEKA
ncbi:MAG: putative DNA binding domain-containing protein [Armatimonadetes bacterium]|nr:putative DNA binding domain-containing protein [Anaerolineae bacterium]